MVPSTVHNKDLATFRKSLPIAEMKEEILSAIEKNQVGQGIHLWWECKLCNFFSKIKYYALFMNFKNKYMNYKFADWEACIEKNCARSLG